METFLTEQDKKKAKLLMLEILKEVHRVCVENDIKYFLHFGTLIGAVRHNGFIPWDDDIDIGMLREDYDKFCELAPKKLSSEYVLQNSKSDRGYCFYFSKVILKDTVWIGEDSLNTAPKYNGICIDVFPFDKIPDDVKLYKNFFKKCGLANYFTLIKFKYRNQNMSDNHAFIKKAIISFFPKLFFVTYRKRLFSKYKKLKENYLICGLWNSSVRRPLTPDCYDEVILHKFESDSFYIPKQYDKVLSVFFGDYMKLPPESERQNHKIIKYDFGKYADWEL